MKKYFGEKQMKLIGILLISFLMVLAVGCSDEKAGNEAAETREHNETEGNNENAEHSEEIVLTAETLKEFGIEVKEAASGVIKAHIDLTGEIIAEPSRISHIIPRFNGIVKEVYKTVGDKVKKGEILAIIESNESLAPYEVQSLIDGTIIEMHMTQGELIGNEAHAFTIADLNKVWANFNIYQKDLGKIKVGQKTLVSAGTTEIEEIGTVSYVSPIVDEKTRTATARVILNNQSGKWLPGMFITSKVYISEKKYSVVVEKTALQTLEEQLVVFVKDEDDGFKPHVVKTGNENDDNIEIVSGLKTGDKYVSKNSFLLKAEILKESFGGDEH
ncbi:MAG: efflux RND transporter periplasmic adaptor subunit [Ignavibacteriae bacterium]|nr:efflux RND transporter periplasmic adaptor subunit [Ignavibacteriota bacterium]